MKNARFLALVVLVLASTSTAACASSGRTEIGAADSGAPSQSTSSTVPGAYDAATFCAALCDRQQECDNALDHQTCKNECSNRQAAVFPKLRSDVVGLIVTCFAEKDCKAVLAGEVVGECAAEGVASVAPSAAAVSYCEAVDKAKKKCGSTAAKAPCLDQAKLYDDDAIAEAQNCTARPCGEVDTCVGAAFGGFGGTSKPTQSTTCTSSQFSDLGGTCAACAASTCCSQAAACAADSSCRGLMPICAYDSGSPSTCQEYLNSASTSTRQLLGAYYSCASQSCTTSCGYINQ